MAAGKNRGGCHKSAGGQYKPAPTTKPTTVRCERTLDYARAINIACNRGCERGRESEKGGDRAKFSRPGVPGAFTRPEFTGEKRQPIRRRWLIYRRQRLFIGASSPFPPSRLVRRLATKGRHRRKPFLSMREQNTIMCSTTGAMRLSSADVLNADCDRKRRIHCLGTHVLATGVKKVDIIRTREDFNCDTRSITLSLNISKISRFRNRIE